MLTRLRIRGFKTLADADIELGQHVVFVGPNNSGKTSALQALALWEHGVQRWFEKRKGMPGPDKRPGVTLSRRELLSMPVPDADQLWRNLHVRDVRRVDGKQKTQNVRVDVIVDGVTGDGAWSCGVEFDYANEESIYCRPLRLSDNGSPNRMAVPSQAAAARVAFLPPMSGLAATETVLQPGAVKVRIGEGRTAEVLRNLCLSVFTEDRPAWRELAGHVDRLFGSKLDDPVYIQERGEVVLTLQERGVRLDLSSTGRGLQQTLLLLAYLYLPENRGAALLLDEPDAHLEILRQRQTYRLLEDVSAQFGSQIICASHSEVVLNEAADRDIVVAFVGKPHRIDDRGPQVLKALREIGFEEYLLAKQTGWMLFLEGSTDLAILRAFARRLGHVRASCALERPFVHYTGNVPAKAADRFHGLREAVPHLRCIAVYDRLASTPALGDNAGCLCWSQREIENYLCTRRTLIQYARAEGTALAEGPLFAEPERGRHEEAMGAAIDELEGALSVLGKPSPWGPDLKVSDEFLAPLFAKYYAALGLPNMMAKTNFHVLADHVPVDEIRTEIAAALDAIADVAEAAQAAVQS